MKFVAYGLVHVHNSIQLCQKLGNIASWTSNFTSHITHFSSQGRKIFIVSPVALGYGKAIICICTDNYCTFGCVGLKPGLQFALGPLSKTYLTNVTIGWESFNWWGAIKILL